jgi:uncharacterized protein
MATISIRVEDDLKDRVEEVAAGEGMSVSEWTRKLFRTELGMDVPSWSAPSSLSKGNRLHLAMLHRLLQLASDDDDEVEHHTRMIEVLQKGFTGEYDDEFAAIQDELPLDECRLVWDILDMFRVIGGSVEKLGIESLKAVDGNAQNALEFRGFDFNDSREGRLAGYAAHVTRDGRWAELAVHFDDNHERGNSHMPVLGSYLRMLAVFQPFWADMVSGPNRGRYHLTHDELLAIVKAWPYPRSS